MSVNIIQAKVECDRCGRLMVFDLDAAAKHAQGLGIKANKDQSRKRKRDLGLAFRHCRILCIPLPLSGGLGRVPRRQGIAQWQFPHGCVLLDLRRPVRLRGGLLDEDRPPVVEEAAVIDPQAIISYLASNQMLVAGVGTVAVGGLAWLARSVPATIKGVASRTLTTTLTVTTRNGEFGDVSRMLSAYSMPALMRTFIPSYHERGISPGYGLGWGRYRGVVFTFQREMLEGKGFEIQERIDIRFFTRRAAIIKEFLSEAEDYREPGKLKIYSAAEWGFGILPQKPKRSLSTVFMDEAVKRQLVDRMGWFIENEQYFLDRGMPYKFCALLYGPPGTGKTSLVHALASKYDLNIIHVNSLQCIDSLERLANPAKDLVVIEAIGALADELKRNTAPEAEGDGPKPMIKLEDGKPILHKLLNALDGFITPHGLKVCITTNHIEKLDAALTRPGRMDVLLEIGDMGEAAIVSMFEAFHGADNAERLRSMIVGGAEIRSLRGSELQELFANKSADEALTAILVPVEKVA